MLVMIEEIEKKIVVDVTRESLMCGSLQPTPFFFSPSFSPMSRLQRQCQALIYYLQTSLLSLLFP